MSAPIPFDSLRHTGVARAESASGAIWTDYNLHDPGVTLLELFCYALTEADYRADFPVADLLTDADGILDLKARDLFPAEDVLPTEPVTLADWDAALSQELPSVARLFIDRHGGESGLAGLYDVFIVPAGVGGGAPSEAQAQQALADVKAAFARRRNLCEDIAIIDIARPVEVDLRAEIRLHRREDAEMTAAQIYDVADQLLQGGDVGRTVDPATRLDVAQKPERYFGQPRQFRDTARSVVQIFDAISRIDSIAGVLSLTLDPPLDSPLTRGRYRRIRTPQRGKDPGLRFSIADRTAAYDLDEMLVYLTRLRAQRGLSNDLTLDIADWQARPNGARRNFDHRPLGHDLPHVYLANGEPLAISASARDRGAAGQIRGFLAQFDALLSSLGADLGNLHDLYSSERPTARTYYPGEVDLAGVLRAIRHEPAPSPMNLADAVAGEDPRHHRKGRALNYLLALYAEQFSQNSLRLHDAYRLLSGRRDAILKNRSRLLKEIATIGRARFLGGPASGMARKLQILLDFPDRSGRHASTAYEDFADPITPAGARPLPRGRRQPPSIRVEDLPWPDDLLAMLPEYIETPPVVPSDLCNRATFLKCGRPSDTMIRVGVRQDAWALAPASNDRWRLFFIPGPNAPAYLCRTFQSRSDAILAANQLREGFCEANRASEAVYTIEDILLRDSDDDPAATPMFLWVVMTGWTTRTRDAEFRDLAEETVVRLCPAHISHRTVWLERREMATFERLLAERDEDEAGVRAAARDLRNLLRAEEAKN